MKNMAEEKQEVHVYLHLREIPENDPLKSRMGKDYFQQSIEEVTREVLRRTSDGESPHAPTALYILEYLDHPETSWKTVSFYKSKGSDPDKFLRVERTTPLEDIMRTQRVGEQDLNTAHIYLIAIFG